MSTPACHRAIGFDTLVEYWLGELDAVRAQEMDLHLLRCDACGARLDDIAALGDGVRRSFDAGLVGVAVGAPFAHRLVAHGLQLREYRVERGGSVVCSVAPEDDVVISRLVAPLAGITRLDLVRRPAGGGAETRAADIPFDATQGEVVLVAPAALLRAMPTGVESLSLVAVETSGDRVLGDYTFNHQASRRAE